MKAQDNSASLSGAEQTVSPKAAANHQAGTTTALQELLDQPLTLAEAARLLPGRPNLSTLWRWRTRGIHGVKLRAVKVGGRVWVPRSALAEFLVARTESQQVAGAERNLEQPCDEPRRRPPETHGRLVAAGLLDGRTSKQRFQEAGPRSSTEQSSLVRKSDP